MWERLVEWYRVVYTMQTTRGTFIARIPYNEARDHLIVWVITIVGIVWILVYFVFLYKENDKCR